MMENFIQILLIIQTIIHVSYCQAPPSICSIVKPFELADKNCGDFTEICVKKDDLYCNNFQAACRQCPPTNFTVSVLLQLKNQVNISDQRIAILKVQNDESQKKIKTLTDILIGFVAVFIICAIIILILMFIVNYESIVQYFHEKFKRIQSRPIRTEHSYDLISNQRDETFQEIINKNNKLIQDMKEIINEKDERFQEIINENNAKLIQDMKEIIKEKDKKLLTEKEIINDLKDNEKRIQKINKITNKKVVSYKLRFQIANQFDETELFVSEFDNVIKLKKSICDRNMNMNDYKRMIMKYKDVPLDNNQYLLSCIDSTNIPIFCEFDNNVDVNAMIVIKLKCDNIYPEMLQIWKHQQIKDIKIIISELNKTNHKDLLIFYKSNKLDEFKTIDYYKIEDNDWIIVVNNFEEMKNISMKSIFTAKETISIEFSKLETVSDIINKSIKLIQHKMATNHFAVFLNNKLLQNDKFIYEYNIDSKSLVEFCYFRSWDEIQIMNKLMNYEHLKIVTARNKISERPLLMKGYTKQFMEREHNKDLGKILEEDLQMFQITKYHSRFIHLIDICMDYEYVYIGLNISTEVTLDKFLLASDNNERPQYIISKWANQMLEGLDHLHNHNIILKDMNPIDIYIDGNHDIKLPSFNMTDYLNHLDENKNEYKHKVLKYVAPEILESKPYEASVDVWSLGVIMIDIVTNGKLYESLNISEIVKKNYRISYN